MITVMASFRVKDGKLEETRKAIQEFVRAVEENESDCLRYESYEGEDGLSFVHLMTFADQAAEKRHQDSEHTKNFTDILHPNCSEGPIFANLKTVATTS